MKHGALIIIGVAFLLLSGVWYVEQRFEMFKPPSEFTYGALYQPSDFENKREGTVVMNFQGSMEEVEHHFGLIPDYIVLINSRQIAGLKIIYNMGAKALEGGIPPMQTSSLDLFDGNPHKLLYTFHVDRGQAFMVDDVKVAEGPYNPSIPKNLITANVVLEHKEPITVDWGNEVIITDSYVGD